MIEASAEFFMGTTHEKDWLFYHDSLSLMTAKDTQAWMKTQFHDGVSYYDRWILPMNGLNDEKFLKRYRNMPTGNSPEYMPLDNVLNKDIHDSVAYHIQFTSHMDIENERKFDMSTPKRGSFAYRRVLDPVDGVTPLSPRIVHDSKLRTHPIDQP